MTQPFVDVILHGESGRVLELRDLHLLDGGSTYQCLLVVRSDGLQLERLFWFEPFSLRTFLDALGQLDATLAGTAKLQPLHEDDYIQLGATQGGHVVVSGEVHSDPQHLRFEFETDQRCVRPFVVALQKAAHSSVAV